MIEIVRAPAHLVVQDVGFSGHRKMGLPRAGAMDLSAFALGNALIGNSHGEPALEWALTGGTLRFAHDVTVALTGARVHGRLGHQMLQSDTPIRIAAGTVLELDRFTSGRFLYLCISPAPAISPVFGSCSTYAPAGIGGFEGRRLRTGDRIPLRPSSAPGSVNAVPKPDYSKAVIRLARAPQSDVLDGRLLTYLLHNRFTISAASDRTGYRLDGPAVDITGLSQLLSEPACEGAIQITDGGTPIVLMADGPTIGGYNKVAVALAADIPVLAQKTPGETVRFAMG